MTITLRAPEDSQSGFFGYIVKSYIEETSASIGAIALNESQFQLADINSLMAMNAFGRGQGGELENTFEPSTIQNNSVQAYEPASTDYLNSPDFKSNKINEYTVQPGDLLSFIASDYGVTINSIIWANNLKNADSISPGQNLRIPPVSGVIHKVKKGDTVQSLAGTYKADAEKIIAYNRIPKDASLDVDLELIIPEGTIAPPVQVAAKKNTVASAKTTIAKRFAYLPDLGGYFHIPTGGFNWGIIHGRNGVDVANSCGTSIQSAADGSVVISDATGYNGGFGKYVKIVHPNGTETIYAHMSKISVAVGQAVAKGQGIGLMGTTGRSTGCHLHFEVHGAKNPLAKY